MEWTKDRDRDDWHPFYRKFEPGIESIKIAIQMLIGILVVSSLFLNAFLFFDQDVTFSFFKLVKNASPLTIVAYGLAIAAGIELAYMLFTPGPDETVEPLIMGVSSTLLLLISKADKFEWQMAFCVILLVGSMGILFYYRERFKLKLK